MDGDNDFQSENFHLVGEENSRSPQILRAFNFPKFDIADNIQVHLRFDSLAETEVFDIQSRESNWIEEFSSRSSAIGFSSAGAESCSIPRHRNVWSEATSSESVEMLLNSVREDEMVNQHILKEEAETHAMDGCSGSRTIDSPDTGPVSPDKSGKIVEPNEDVIISQLQNVGTPETSTEMEKYGINKCSFDGRLRSSEEAVPDLLTIDGIVPSSLKVDVKDCPPVDEHFQVADKSLNFKSMDDNAPDDLACDVKANNTELISDYGPWNASIDTKDVHYKKPSPDRIMEEHNEVGASEKPDFLPDYKENIAEQFLTVDNIDGDIINKHDYKYEVLKNTSSLETCRDPSPLLNEESSSVVLPQSSDGLLESIAYPANFFKMEKRSIEEISTSTMDLHCAAVSCNADSERKSPDNIEGFSVQICESERSKFSGEGSIRNDSNHETMSRSSLEMVNLVAERGHAPIVNLGEEEDRTLMKTLADKKELKVVCSDSSCNLTSSECSQRTDKNVVKSFDTCPQDSSTLGSSVVQKNSDDCTEDITARSAKSEAIEHIFEKSSVLSDDVENTTSTSQKMVQMFDTITSSTDGNEVTEIEGKLLIPIKEYTKETVDLCNNESSVNVTIETTNISRVMDSSDELNVGKPEGTTSSSLSGSKVLQQVCSDVLQADATLSSLAKGHDEKDAYFSPLSAASKSLDSKTSSQPLFVSNMAVTCSLPVDLPKGSGDVDTPTQPTLQINEADPLYPDSSVPETSDATCGSPTIISANDNSKKVEYQVSSKSPINPHLSVSETSNLGEAENPNNTKEGKTSEDDGGFTFEIQPLADISPKDTSSNWKPFSKCQLDEQSLISRENESEPKDASKQTDITINIEEDKRNQTSGHESRKGGTPRGNGKEKVQQKRARGKEKTPNSTTPSEKGRRRKSRTEDVKQHPFVESSSTKSPLTPIIQTSSKLPDLNSSSTRVLLQQPFTDLQQIQLRAQIFVYGSLIQGLPPDETCMVSAFGGTEADGGKNLWQSAWHTALDRFQNQKSPFYHPDTPLHPRQAVSAAEQGSSFIAPHIKGMNSPSSWSGSKVVSSGALSSTTSYTTLWSVSPHDELTSSIPRSTQLELNQVVSPLHQYSSPAIRQYANASAPWLSQSPRPSSWGFSGSSVDTTVQYSLIPASEAIKVTPISSASLASNVQVTQDTASLPNQSVLGVSAISVATLETPKGKANAKIESGSQKSRKSKKTTVPEELGLTLPEPVVEPNSVVSITKNLPSSTGLPSAVSSPNTVASLAASIPHSVPSYFQMIGVEELRPRAIVSEESSTHNELSKLQAASASADATAAVKHCQGIWDQLVNKQKSGLGSDVKSRLVSAAAAAAAAASVAKAAAEAAKVASEAALQAKLMADEALSSIGTESSSPNTEFGFDSGKGMARSTLTAISKGKDSDIVQGSSSIISSAREAARKRVEAASAATKRAENMDAIVKAAELAAEAVSHAGTVISMGNPLPFSVRELVEIGPESYWKLHRQSQGTDAENNDACVDESENVDVDVNHDGSDNQYLEHPSIRRKKQVLTDVDGMTSKNKVTVHSDEKNDGNGPEKTSLLGSSIKKGSLVEVAANEDGLRGVWFSAWVIDVKEGKASVCYKDLLDEGHGQLKEWIPLYCDSGTAPRIRNAHPSTVARSEGTRKRRRDAVANYSWEVGDRVDAWLREGWWEGIVMEKCKEDETKLTVHFPAGGDSSVVRAGNLRPSLIWRDGQWVEWSRSREQPYKGDTPYEKRQKKGQFEFKSSTEIAGKNSYTEDSGKLEESGQLNSSDKEKIFALGKNTIDDNLIDPIKVKRIGLQKEGSRVVFGIPKPGKKRKFMEVSKHYIVDNNKTVEGNEPMKFTQYLMPQSSNLQRNMSKVDGKGKQTFDSKAKGLKSLRSQSNQARITSERDDSESSRNLSQNHRKFLSNEDRTLDKNSQIHGTTDVSEKSGFSVIESSVRLVPHVQLSQNKTCSSVEVGKIDEGNVLSSMDKSNRLGVKISENSATASTGANEPRRSNRTIQPTSRLLEGLQSSLSISKIPNVFHDKGNRTSQRSAASSQGHSQG